jgi:putative ABC transport system permease protein
VNAASAPAAGWLGAVVAATFVGLAVLVAWREQLGLTRDILIASLRAFGQLALVGLILLYLFQHSGLWGALAWVVVMVVIAGGVSARRAPSLPAARATATAAIALATTVTLGLLLVLRLVPPEPRYVVPIGGMVVAGAMQASSLSMRGLVTQVQHTRPKVEAALALGLAPTQAFASSRRDAVRSAVVPAIDATRVVGLISLPGTMTGLILAGTSPIVAVRYQIVVMYLLLAASLVAAATISRRSTHLLFDDAQRLIALRPQ